jgi:hypothetical protein
MRGGETALHPAHVGRPLRTRHADLSARLRLSRQARRRSAGALCGTLRFGDAQQSSASLLATIQIWASRGRCGWSVWAFAVAVGVKAIDLSRQISRGSIRSSLAHFPPGNRDCQDGCMHAHSAPVSNQTVQLHHGRCCIVEQWLHRSASRWRGACLARRRPPGQFQRSDQSPTAQAHSEARVQNGSSSSGVHAGDAAAHQSASTAPRCSGSLWQVRWQVRARDAHCSPRTAGKGLQRNPVGS